MRKLLASFSALLVSASCFATVEVNQASEADLDSIRGIGPALSGKILAERQKAPFRDWQDLMRRVKGIRSHSAARLSDAGLSVNGAGYSAEQPTAPK